MPTKERNSAFELLRIIAMSFIVVWHISVHAQQGELESHNYVIAICATGVNLFVLISGYFGIRLYWKSLLTLVSTIAFFNLAIIIGKWSATKTLPQPCEIKSLLAPVTNTHWWFINCYFHLMLLSPVINIVLNKASDRQYKYLLGMLLFMSCISGFVFGNSINLTGYNTFHFVTIYVVGDAIKRLNLPAKLPTKKYLALYITCVLGLLVYAMAGIPGSTNYNNPLVLAGAVSLFCLIARLNFHNKTVNYVATFMLPVYLIQDSSIGFSAYGYLYRKGQIMNFQGFDYFAIIALYILALLGSAFMLDTIRRFILKRPINSISRTLEKKANIFG
ncbi:MAG: acyltransferase family protein [Bacteroidaceae bacterium]|nr:acyltransferase family protein [Bacteroidaceae bacterium]